jgi:hypothetical protein
MRRSVHLTAQFSLEAVLVHNLLGAVHVGYRCGRHINYRCGRHIGRR